MLIFFLLWLLERLSKEGLRSIRVGGRHGASQDASSIPT